MSKFNNIYIVSEYLKGRNTNDLARELGTYNTSIRRILIQSGTAVRNSAEVWSNRNNPFLDISGDYCQYWLGLLATDGNIFGTRVCLQLSSKDGYIVDKFGQFVSAVSRDIFNKTYRTTERRCEFKDKAIASTLMSYGITPEKSKTLELTIPITWSLFRGIVDGDGYIRKSPRVSIEIATASSKFAEQLGNFLHLQGVRTRTRKLKSGLFIVGVYSKNDVFKCYNEMYNTATIFLQRKKDSFGLLISEMNRIQDLQIQGTLLGNPEPSLSNKEGAETRRRSPKSKDMVKV